MALTLQWAQYKRRTTDNMVSGTLAVNGWAVTFSTARRGLVVVPNVTSHPSTASVPTSYYLFDVTL